MKTLVALVVEDHPVLMASLSQSLIYLFPELKVEVVEAINGQKAVKLIQAGLRPDIIITDNSMPKMTGVEFSAWMKKHSDLRLIPIILMSIDLEPKNHKADAFIPKNNLISLELHIRALCDFNKLDEE